ncbi:hypothetical protein [Methanoculleus taiwanensis]|nr:hypothetical protein [Methanoculleus taiwanensis]
MNCDLCGAPGTRFLRVNHESRGIVLLCDACREREKGRLRPLPKRGGCC